MCLGLTTNKSRMRILLDTYYLFGLMERGEFSSRQVSFFNAHQELVDHPLAITVS